jgi:branched-chain amino acid transport system ATP-binding protein
MLEIGHLEVSIGAAPILRGVSLDVAAGSVCGIIGRNGAGKTTLMRAIVGALPTRSGTIRLDGVDLARMASYRRARMGIGYMPEDRRLVPELTAEDNILLPAWASRSMDPATRLRMTYEVIPELRGLAKRRTMQLSGGQQKIVAIARAMTCGTRLLLLDEPLEGVAPALAERIGYVIAGLKRLGVSALIAESDAKILSRVLDRVYVIERGGVRLDG